MQFLLDWGIGLVVFSTDCNYCGNDCCCIMFIFSFM